MLKALKHFQSKENKTMKPLPPIQCFKILSQQFITWHCESYTMYKGSLQTFIQEVDYIFHHLVPVSDKCKQTYDLGFPLV